MMMVYQIGAASARLDIAQMQALSLEHSTRKTYLFSFIRPLLRWPILAKNFSIDTLRMPHVDWVIAAGIYLATLVIYDLELFPPLTMILFAFGLASTYSFIIKVYSQKVRDLLKKRKAGLFLPYSLVSISTQSAIIPSLILMIVIIASTLLSGLPLVAHLIGTVMLVGLCVANIFLSAKFLKAARLIDAVSYVCTIIITAIPLNLLQGL
jgi:hypothetical protein